MLHNSLFQILCSKHVVLLCIKISSNKNRKYHHIEFYDTKSLYWDIYSRKLLGLESEMCPKGHVLKA
jgi:hypothetical protein